ncbi:MULTISPECIES: non-homologous end-joining DNA ligase [unclassified Streptomyces]|uniref:non-homologous end-joining DNA ligase n=1 Tax=unclassified Streptomyces TaxID=2593676 RepID=UPI0022B6B258|nr:MULTISPECIES: non-homologous end-joining DNA ligase [unclassified Streptomyces]MCZ7416386.1 non-homologous end-joining DNA ligase [Streptomyces sp. WMMC897]MCZ7433804.1 non-homologous end-joining DNA ligase [Streptomyces sp. WMMC1477]
MPPMTNVAGRRLALSNLDKVLYPDGTTKGELLHYYATCADALLPHLTGRPVSFLRYPDGSTGEAFFSKNVPPGTPEWVTVADVPRSSRSTGRQVVIDDLPALVWAANLVTELHVPQWRHETPARADRLVLDLDPGAPASVAECCAVAEWLRERLAEDGLEAWPKTSGGKGLHLMAALRPTPSDEVSRYAKRLAARAERELDGLAVHRMDRSLRPGRVFIDHSQNNAAKTTAAPYTARAAPTPTVSTPLTWEEVAAGRAGRPLSFDIHALPGRIAEHGDLLAPLLDAARARRLPGH